MLEFDYLAEALITLIVVDLTAARCRFRYAIADIYRINFDAFSVECVYVFDFRLLLSAFVIDIKREIDFLHGYGLCPLILEGSIGAALD